MEASTGGDLHLSTGGGVPPTGCNIGSFTRIYRLRGRDQDRGRLSKVSISISARMTNWISTRQNFASSSLAVPLAKEETS